MRLTLIIPMYKAEKYISDCLYSILNQDKKNIDYDIVAINDGSPDKCAETAETILKNSGIKYTIINQQNQGPGAARNTGINAAEGEFIWFIDSDDTIDENSFYELSKIKTEGIDAVAINGNDKIGNALKPRMNFGNFAEKIVDGQLFFRSNRWSVCPPLTIYRKDFLSSNNLQYLPYIYHEDNEFATRALFMVKKIYVTEKAIYNIRETPKSITRSVNPKRSFDLITVATLLDKFKNENTIDIKDIKVFQKQISVCLNGSLENNENFCKTDIIKLRESLFDNRRLFKNMLNYPSLKYKIEASLFMLFPKHIIEIYNKLNILIKR